MSRKLWWLAASIAFSLLLSLAAMRIAFGSDYVIQDDARQHVTWMWRYVDPEIFRGDWIADYFGSVSPLGVRTVYRSLALVGIDPLLASKLLPTVLGLVTTLFCFGFASTVVRSPAGAFLTTVIVNQTLWARDGVISATPKAFVAPILFAFLHFVAKESAVGAVVAIAAMGLFYPTLVFQLCGILVLQLVVLRDGRLMSTDRTQRFVACGAGLVAGAIVLAPYALGSSHFGPTLKLAIAKTLPEMNPGGGAPFFAADRWTYWTKGRSGLALSIFPRTIALGLLLPLARGAFERAGVLVRAVIASLVMFFAAHAVLFMLHLPSRQTLHTLRFVLALGAAFVIVAAIEAILRGTGNRPIRRLAAALLVLAVFAAPLATRPFPWTGYTVGEAPELYEFLARQPKDTLVATLSTESSNIPSFTRRMVLAGDEYAVAYHWGYFQEFRGRVLGMIEAQYASDLAPAKRLIEHYGIDLWLLDADAFKPSYVEANGWIHQYAEGRRAAERLRRGERPALAAAVESCAVLTTTRFTVLDAACILRSG